MEFDTLAARPGVTAREKTWTVDAERFAAAQERVESGLDWGVGAVVTDDRGRVLLVFEDGRWLAPGGKVEVGETHEGALRREVREETGIEVRVDDLVAVTAVIIEHDRSETDFQFAHYTATPETTTLTENPGLSDEDIDAVEWHDRVPEETVDREVVVGNR